MNAATLKLFSDPHVLRQLGRPLFTEFFERFTHLLPSKYFLPNPRPDNEAYFDSLAEVLACTLELPDGLAQALFEVETLAGAEDNELQDTDATPLSEAIQSWLLSHATDLSSNGTPESSDMLKVSSPQTNGLPSQGRHEFDAPSVDVLSPRTVVPSPPLDG